MYEREKIEIEKKKIYKRYELDIDIDIDIDMLHGYDSSQSHENAKICGVHRSENRCEKWI